MKKIILIALLLTLVNAKDKADNVYKAREVYIVNKDKTLTRIDKSDRVKKNALKAGFLFGLGVGGGYAFGNSTYYDDTNTTTLSNKSLVDNIISGNSHLIVGYQRYFDEFETFGFDIKVLPTFFYNEYDHKPSGRNIYYGFGVGGEINLIWDFGGTFGNAAGIHFGGGYTFAYNISDIYSTMQAGNLSKTSRVFNYFSHTIYPQIGIHYFGSHHQIYLTFRVDFASINNNGKFMIRGDYIQPEIVLDYAYRF